MTVPPGFRRWLRGPTNRLLARAADVTAADLAVLMSWAEKEGVDLLTCNLRAEVERHPRVTKADLHRSRAGQGLRRAGRLYREYMTVRMQEQFLAAEVAEA